MPFDGNYYWMPKKPGTHCRDVKVLEYSDRLRIYQNRECLAEYALPADEVKNRLFSPEGMPKPVRQRRIASGPRKRRRSGCVPCRQR